jgi:hypothetical protein
MLPRLAILLVLVSPGSFAQGSTPSGVTYIPSGSPTQVELPALTPVMIQFDDTVSSETHKNGDRFRFHVAADVRVGDALVIPAGTPGEGEVIHAQKSGMAGKAGELIVAARYVTVNGRALRLRSFAAGTGAQHSELANWSSLLISYPALMIQGGVMTMPRTMIATARTAQSARLPSWKAVSQPGDEPVEISHP